MGRVKVLTIAYTCDECDDEHEEIRIVPDHVTPMQAMTEDTECICICFDQEDAVRMVDAWNARYGSN